MVVCSSLVVCKLLPVLFVCLFVCLFLFVVLGYALCVYVLYSLSFLFRQATVKSMNITEADWEMKCAWSDFNACFVGTSDETQGTEKKLIDFFGSGFSYKLFNAKVTLNDKAKSLAHAAKEEKKMDVGEMQDILVSERNAKAASCKALAKRKPNPAAMRTPLKVSE